MKDINISFMKILISMTVIINFVTFCNQVIAKDLSPSDANEMVVFYFSPDWLNNDEVVYIKIADYYKRTSGFLAQLDKSDVKFITREAGVYAHNINTNKTKLIKLFEKDQLSIEKLSSAKRGNKFALVDTKGRLYSMNKDGSDLKMIFFKKDRTEHLDGSPALDSRSYEVGVHQAWISPDGTKILYNITEYDPLYEWETWEGGRREKLVKIYSTSSLWLINSDGTGNKLLVEGASFGAWYPDGENIWFISTKVKHYQNPYYKINIDSTELVELIEDNKLNPTIFSPDGKKRLGELKKIRPYGDGVITLDGEELCALAPLYHDVKWSPDSKKLLGSDAHFKYVAIIEVDTGKLKKILDL